MRATARRPGGTANGREYEHWYAICSIVPIGAAIRHFRRRPRLCLKGLSCTRAESMPLLMRGRALGKLPPVLLRLITLMSEIRRQDRGSPLPASSCGAIRGAVGREENRASDGFLMFPSRGLGQWFGRGLSDPPTAGMSQFATRLFGRRHANCVLSRRRGAI